MDVAREAFVRHVALDRWRDLEDLQETNGLDLATAAREAGRFVERWPYQAVWTRRWEEQVMLAAGRGDGAAVFAAIEAAVAAAVEDEISERTARGDTPLELDPQFRAFLDQALGKLSRESAGGLESLPP